MKDKIGTINAPDLPNNISNKSQWLSGQGGGVWFHIEKSDDSKFLIKRYTPTGKLDCERIFKIEDNGSIFDIEKPYEFIHISHCAKCRIKQNNIVFVFNYIEK